MSQIADANPLDAGSNANSVESAAAGFDRMFAETEPTEANRDDEDKAPKQRRSEPRAAPDADDDDGQAASDDEHDPILDGDADGDTGDDDADDADADDADDKNPDDDDDDEDDVEHEVTVNGKVEKVKTSELIAGYAKEADYRQKTARLGEERREIEEFAQESVAVRQQYVDGAETFISMAQALAPSKEDWDALKKSDPNTFIVMQEQWSAIGQKMQEAREAKATADAHAAQEEQRKHNAFVRSEGEKLFEKVPALANPKKAKEFQDLIMTYGKAAGYSEEELFTGAVDHRDILTLYKAARFDEIQKSRKAGQRPPKPGPKPSSTSSQVRVIARTGKNAKTVRDANRRAASTGSLDDAAHAFDAAFGLNKR